MRIIFFLVFVFWGWGLFSQASEDVIFPVENYDLKKCRVYEMGVELNDEKPVFLIDGEQYVYAYEIPDSAFPTIIGAGRNATGGEGGQICEVTNLNDSGSGSLRNCVNIDARRVVHFSVSGRIVLQSPLNIGSGVDEGDITIAGETAPGKGIAIVTSGNNTSVNGAMSSIYGSNVIFRFIRYWRLGEEKGSNSGLLSVAGTSSTPASNIVVDHCMFGWSSDDLFGGAFYGAENITASHNIFHESTLKYGGSTAKGALWYSNYKNLTFYGNLWAHVETRAAAMTPYFQHSYDDFINNVVYNRKSQGMSLGIRRAGSNTAPDIDGSQRMNIIGNEYIAGNDTFTIGGASPRYDMNITAKDDSTNSTGDASGGFISYYVEDNRTNTRTTDSQPEWDVMGYDPNASISGGNAPTSKRSLVRFESGFDFSRIVPRSDVKDFVLNTAGNIIEPDVVTLRLKNDLINGTGNVPETEPDEFPFSYPDLGVSSWVYKPGTLIPETWADAHGVNSNDQIKSTYEINGQTYLNTFNKTAYEVWRFDRAGDLARLSGENIGPPVSPPVLINKRTKQRFIPVLFN